MFVNAIEEIQQFTRPLHMIYRYYGNDYATPVTGTLFFINEYGVAITCKHISDILRSENQINQTYSNFKKEKISLGTKIDVKYRKALRELELNFGLKRQESVAQIRCTIVNSVESPSDIEHIPHPSLDLAILKFNGFSKTHYTSHATFLKDLKKVKQGKSLCRYGYPFPAYDNFVYDSIKDDIEFTSTGICASSPFPIDGIITRHISDGSEITGIEMSTPGLKGQSGGPLFDENGLVYGLQFATQHLHLGFDIENMEVSTEGKKLKITNHPFLHVGQCVHVEKIKEFLTIQNIPFYEA